MPVAYLDWKPTGLLSQLRSNWRAIVSVIVVSIGILSTALYMNIQRQIPMVWLTRDPNAINGLAFYNGYVSQLGIFFWAGSVAICLFCVAALPRNPDATRLKRFFRASALLSLALGLDDVFLGHEVVFPRLGIPEKLVLLGYATLFALYLGSFYRIILNDAYIMMGMAFAFFGLSVGLDLLSEGFSLIFLEDGAKLVGIISWFGFFFCVGTSAVRANPRAGLASSTS